MLSCEDNTLTVKISSTDTASLRTLTHRIKEVEHIRRLNIYWTPKTHLETISPYDTKLDRKGKIPPIQLFITKLLIKILTHDIFEPLEVFCTDIAFHDLKFFNKDYEEFHQWYDVWWMTYMWRPWRRLKTLLVPYNEFRMLAHTSEMMFRVPGERPRLTVAYIDYPKLQKICRPDYDNVMCAAFADMVENGRRQHLLSYSHSLRGTVILAAGAADKFFVLYKDAITFQKEKMSCELFSVHDIQIEDVPLFREVDWNSEPMVLRMMTIDRGVFSKLHPANFEFLRERSEAEGAGYYLFYVKMYCYYRHRAAVLEDTFADLDGHIGHIVTQAGTFHCEVKVAFHRHLWQLHHLTRIIVSQPFITAVKIHSTTRGEIRPILRSIQLKKD
jgi:hypothetical protein